MVGSISAQQISLIFFFWVGLDQNMSGLGLHGCWPDSATMLINLPFHAEREVLHAATNFAAGGGGGRERRRRGK